MPGQIILLTYEGFFAGLNLLSSGYYFGKMKKHDISVVFLHGTGRMILKDPEKHFQPELPSRKKSLLLIMEAGTAALKWLKEFKAVKLITNPCNRNQLCKEPGDKGKFGILYAFLRQ